MIYLKTFDMSYDNLKPVIDIFIAKFTLNGEKFLYLSDNNYEECRSLYVAIVESETLKTIKSNLLSSNLKQLEGIELDKLKVIHRDVDSNVHLFVPDHNRSYLLFQLEDVRHNGNSLASNVELFDLQAFMSSPDCMIESHQNLSVT